MALEESRGPVEQNWGGESPLSVLLHFPCSPHPLCLVELKLTDKAGGARVAALSAAPGLTHAQAPTHASCSLGWEREPVRVEAESHALGKQERYHSSCLCCHPIHALLWTLTLLSFLFLSYYKRHSVGGGESKRVVISTAHAQFSNTWTVNFQMFKLVLEKAEEPETNCQHLLDHQKAKRVPEKYLFLL